MTRPDLVPQPCRYEENIRVAKPPTSGDKGHPLILLWASAAGYTLFDHTLKNAATVALSPTAHLMVTKEITHGAPWIAQVFQRCYCFGRLIVYLLIYSCCHKLI